MDDSQFESILTGRRSVRGYLPDPIPADTMASIFDMARAAPSNCNIQPWKVYVASGDARNELATQLYGAASMDEPPAPDFDMLHSYEGELRQRQVECAVALYDNLGISRVDKVARKQAMLENFRFFGAPHAAFITMPKGLTVFNGMDVGIYLQTLLLCMSRHGVASCAQGALALYPNIVKSSLAIPSEEGLLVGISFGYEDTEVPANKTITSREPVTQLVKFIGH